MVHIKPFLEHSNLSRVSEITEATQAKLNHFISRFFPDFQHSERVWRLLFDDNTDVIDFSKVIQQLRLQGVSIERYIEFGEQLLKQYENEETKKDTAA